MANVCMYVRVYETTMVVQQHNYALLFFLFLLRIVSNQSTFLLEILFEILWF